MPGIRIPGAESIDPIAPGRDPGVQATPDQFGAGIAEAGQRNAQAVEQLGVSENHIADALGSLGAHLERKRQDAEDQVYVQTHAVDSAVRIQAAQLKARQDFPDGGPGYMEALNTGIQQANDSVTADLAARGLRPSQRASARVATQFAGTQSNALVNGVTYDNNANIKKLQDQNTTNGQAIASQVFSGNLDAETAIKQSDANLDATRSLYGGGELEGVKRAARDAIYQADVDRAIVAKDPKLARELNSRYFGGSPLPGQKKADQVESSDDAIFKAIYGQESGSGRNTTTSITGARGGMQIQPATFAQYAKPGERIDNPADNLAVGRRIIDDLSEKSGGDPARIAVGYFSGPGNIAPAGSPTPYKVDKADPTGKTTSSYVSDVVRRLSGGDSPNVSRALTNNNRIESMDAVNREDTKSAITDDLASMSATGVGDSTLTTDRITTSLGPNAADDWVTARARAKDFYDKTQDFPTLPPEELNARLIALAPKPGQEEYAAQDALHNAAIKKADAIMEMRKKDPAESVSDDPQVKAAIAAAKPGDPIGMKAIITARLAAQKRAGIFAPAPIPVDETQRLLKPINEAVQMEDLDRTKGGPSRVVLAQKQLVQDLKDKYGSYSDDVMREVIGQAANSRDRLALADAAGSVMKALITGDSPDPKEARRLRLEREAAAAAKATAAAAAAPPAPSSFSPFDGIVPPTVAPPPPPTRSPSAKSVQILLSAPPQDQARLAGLFDKEFGAGSAAALLNRKVTPTGTTTVDDTGEGWKPE